MTDVAAINKRPCKPTVRSDGLTLVMVHKLVFLFSEK